MFLLKGYDRTEDSSILVAGANGEKLHQFKVLSIVNCF